MNVLVQGLYGLGDNVFQRPFIRAALNKYGALWLQTSWPELYEDLGDSLYFVKPQTLLRTQAKNIDRNRGRWTFPPSPINKRFRLRYGAELYKSNIIEIMNSQLPLGDFPFRFDLPDFRQEVAIKIPEPYAIVRPVTVRTEWCNVARNPLPQYVQEAVYILKDCGLTVVSVADIEPGKEDYVCGPLQGCDHYFDKGQLTVKPLLALVQNASVVVGGVGWIAPVSIAARVPLFLVLGGQGGHNAIERITDPRMDLSRLGWATPDNYCKCIDMKHDCPKVISNFESKLRRFIYNGCYL